MRRTTHRALTNHHRQPNNQNDEAVVALTPLGQAHTVPAALDQFQTELR
jgi:hypothetical protein